MATQTRSDLLGFLQDKVRSAEASLKAREQMAETWAGGTNEEWKMACAMRPNTIGKAMSKEARLKEAETHRRIAVKCRHEVEMFRAVIGELFK